MKWRPPNYWTAEEIEHWKSLDHSFCTQVGFGSDEPAYVRCVGTHCHVCGKGTSSQGHLDFSTGTGVCPTPIEERKPWP